MKINVRKITIEIISIILVVCSCLSYPAFCEEPIRGDGLSAHWVPGGVASLSENGKVQASFLTFYRSKGQIVREYYCSTPTDLIDYFKSLASSFQNNGIWLVMTHPDSYSPKELKMKSKLIKLCQKSKIRLFICRGPELPNGWQKY